MNNLTESSKQEVNLPTKEDISPNYRKTMGENFESMGSMLEGNESRVHGKSNTSITEEAKMAQKNIPMERYNKLSAQSSFCFSIMEEPTPLKPPDFSDKISNKRASLFQSVSFARATELVKLQKRRATLQITDRILHLPRLDQLLQIFKNDKELEMILKRGLRRRYASLQRKKAEHREEIEKLVSTFTEDHEKLLNNALAEIKEADRLQKAADYFQDAMFSRKIRFSFPNKKIRFIYKWQMHGVWSSLVSLMVWIMLLITFWEPSGSKDRPFELYGLTWGFCFGIELTAIIIFMVDDVFEYIHRTADTERGARAHFLHNCKFLWKYFIDGNLIIDFLLFWILYTYGIPYFRYARLLRPFKLIVLSRELRRFSKAILQTMPYIIDIVILFILVCFMFAIIGIKIFEDLDLDEDQIKEENNFQSIGKAINTLWILITLENYPDAIRPYVDESPYYFLYFFPFIFIALIFLMPIPVAVVFDTFRSKRRDLYLVDRMRERVAIYSVFVCLDIEGHDIYIYIYRKGYLTKEQWHNFMKALYGGMQDEENVELLFIEFDINHDNELNMLEFFEICDVAMNITDLKLPYLCNPIWWHKFRMFCNNKLYLKAIITSTYFEIFIFLVILVNIVILILYAIYSDEETIYVLDCIDRGLLSIFCAEVVLKIIGLGIVDYFGDNWNRFDFGLVLCSIFLDVSVNLMKIAKTSRSAKSAKLARISRSQKSLKLLKGLRSFRAARILNAGMATFYRIKAMIQKTLMCYPSVKKLLTLVFSLCYIYSIIGLESFGVTEPSDYQEDIFGDFSSFSMAMAILFQVVTQSNWHCVVFHYATKSNYTGSIFFFYSFQMMTVVILLSLIVGLIWEVFITLDKAEFIEKKKETNETEKAAKETDPIVLDPDGKSDNKAVVSDFDKESVMEEDAPPKKNIMSSLKSNYYLKKALLRNTNNLEEKEAAFLHKRFSSYKDRIDKVIGNQEAKAIEDDKERRGGALLLRSLRFFKTGESKNNFFTNLNEIFVKFQLLCPIGSCVSLLFDRSETKECFMSISERELRLVEFQPIKTLMKGHPPLYVANLRNFYSVEVNLKEIPEEVHPDEESTDKKCLPPEMDIGDPDQGKPPEEIEGEEELKFPDEKPPFIVNIPKEDPEAYKEDLIRSFRHLAQRNNWTSLQLENYKSYDWSLMVSELTIKHDGSNMYTQGSLSEQVDSDSEKTVRVWYGNKYLIEEDQSIERAYFVCLTPRPKGAAGERRMNLMMSVIKGLMGRQISKEYSNQDVIKLMGEYMCLLDYFKKPIFKEATELAKMGIRIETTQINTSKNPLESVSDLSNLHT